jgi:hypothetical protein
MLVDTAIVGGNGVRIFAQPMLLLFLTLGATCGVLRYL